MSKNSKCNFESNVMKEEIRMYKVPVYKVSLVKESSQQTFTKNITRPNDVYELAKNYLVGADREHFVVIMLDTKNKIIGINTVSIGTLSSCPIHPREVFKPAIISNSTGIILVHNHPSGDPNPSQDDMALTNRLKEAGDILGISVVDHIVIGDERYASLKERGQLQPFLVGNIVGYFTDGCQHRI